MIGTAAHHLPGPGPTVSEEGMTAPADSLDVLLALDDDELRQSYRSLLEAHGLTCAEAATGEEAIELARNRQPRCVLIDVVLSGMDGPNVARTLRADPRTSGAHIHCLTRPMTPETLLEAARATGERGLLTCGPLVEAEDLLDWLENNGCTGIEVSVKGGQMTVRFVCPPGLRLVRDDSGQVRLCPVTAGG
jgi:CheY-like chemotaxis protein